MENTNIDKYALERKCMQNALGRVSTLLALSNNDEVDNIIKLTNCMNSIVCQIRNLEEDEVSLYGVTSDSSDEDEIDFTVE